MALTFEPIATTTLGSAATEITFSSIPQTYTDLCIIAGIKMNGSYLVYCRVNGGSSAGYGAGVLEFNGSAASATTYNSQSDGWLLGTALASQYPIAMVVDIPSYTNTIVNKTAVSHYGGSSTSAGKAGIATSVNTTNSSTITSLTIRNSAGENFFAGSFATLYGILGA